MWLLLWFCLSPARACTHDASITVATLNAWGLPAPVASDRRGRMPRIAQWVQDRGYDLVGLEELWHGALRLLHLPDLTTPATSGDSGLALFTRHRVLSKRTHTFREEVGFDTWKAKGLMTAEVQVDEHGEPIVVAVTHLQAGGSRRASLVREEQVREIARVLADEQRPVVLLGDFNLYDDRDADDRSRRHLEEAGFVDSALAAGVTDGTYPGYKDRFDRIFVRDGASRCLVTKRAAVLDPRLSDHRAVEAELEVGS